MSGAAVRLTPLNDTVKAMTVAGAAGDGGASSRRCTVITHTALAGHFPPTHAGDGGGDLSRRRRCRRPGAGTVPLLAAASGGGLGLGTVAVPAAGAVPL